MGDDNDSRSLLLDLLKLREALRLEIRITYGEDLIDEKDLGVYVDCD